MDRTSRERSVGRDITLSDTWTVVARRVEIADELRGAVVLEAGVGDGPSYRIEGESLLEVIGKLATAVAKDAKEDEARLWETVSAERAREEAHRRTLERAGPLAGALHDIAQAAGVSNADGPELVAKRVIAVLKRPQPKAGAADPPEDGVLERHRAAADMLRALCLPRGSEGAREWMMSIPARPGVDPDLVIGASLADIPRLQDEVDRLRDQLARTREETNARIADLGAEVAETRRRHESDARDLEDCRRTLREETADASKAWGLVDALADALLKAAPYLAFDPIWRRTFAGPTDNPSAVLREVEAALRKAGRLEPSR